MAIKTDSTPVEDPKDPEACNLFKIFKLFAPVDRLKEVHELYVNGGAAYGRIKLELLDILCDYFGEARKKRAALEGDQGYVRDVLRQGAEKARQKASGTLDLVRERVGLKY
jgi:tryptophanyl-tRNA synthetase